MKGQIDPGYLSTWSHLIKVISVLCKKLNWLEQTEEINCSRNMDMNFTKEAFLTLKTVLAPNQMLAVYMMAMDKEMPKDVTEETLKDIIQVLCKELKWIEEKDETHIHGKAAINELNSIPENLELQERSQKVLKEVRDFFFSTVVGD